VQALGSDTSKKLAETIDQQTLISAWSLAYARLSDSYAPLFSHRYCQSVWHVLPDPTRVDHGQVAALGQGDDLKLIMVHKDDGDFTATDGLIDPQVLGATLSKFLGKLFNVGLNDFYTLAYLEASLWAISRAGLSLKSSTFALKAIPKHAMFA